VTIPFLFDFGDQLKVNVIRDIKCRGEQPADHFWTDSHFDDVKAITKIRTVEQSKPFFGRSNQASTFSPING
jgi:hypothetical protein